MLVLLFSSSDPNEIDCQKPTVMAHGDTVDDLIPALCDDVVTEVQTHTDSKLFVWGFSEGDQIPNMDISSLCDAVHEGITHITQMIPAGQFNAEYCNNWSIEEIELD